MNFFVINGHEYYPYSKGELNKTLFFKIVDKLKINNDVKTTIVADGYDIESEIEKFKWADMIIFQSPINWFSISWSFKRYFDYVYRHGIFYQGSNDYGEGGLFKDKKYMYSMTMNSPENSFYNSDSFYGGMTPDEMIISLHKLQQFCGMKPIKSFFCFDVVHNPKIPQYLKDLDYHIDKYVLVS